MALIDFSYHLKGNTHEIEDLYFLLFCCIKHGCGNCFPAPVATFTHSLQKLLRKMHYNLLAVFAQNLFFFKSVAFWWQNREQKLLKLNWNWSQHVSSSCFLCQSLYLLPHTNTNHHIWLCVSQRVDEQKPKGREVESVQLCGRIWA